MTIIRYLSAAVLITALGAGCASTPKSLPELDAARSEVQQALADPLAQEAAAMSLKKAEEALHQADESLRQHKPMAQIQQQAYVATRQAQIAKEQTAELRSRKAIEQGQADRNRVQLEARTTEAAVAQGKAVAAQSAAAQAQAEAAQANNAAAMQAAEAAAARDKLAAATEESARLRSELEGLQAKQTERGMVLTLGDVLFDTGRAEIRPGAMLTIDRLAAFLQKRPAFAVMIEGHTDNVGQPDYNRVLSQRRADAVAAALSARGVSVERIRSRGLGQGYPNASNNSAGGRQQNRRVEIVFSDEKGQFSPAAERLAGP